MQVCPIQDDEDGHLSYKLGDVIEHDNQRCEYMYVQYCLYVVYGNLMDNKTDFTAKHHI